MTQGVLQKLSHVLNSGEFITNDVGFSASVLFSRPERKGGKRAGAGPGQKIWEKMAKESKCVCEIKNKDSLCCSRAIVVMREYARRQAGEPNTFENIRQDRGNNTQQLKEAKKLHKEACVSEGLCGLEEIETFQEYLGPKGFRIIVVDATQGGVIFKGDKYEDRNKIIAIVKSVYVDENNQEKAHYDGLYSIPGFMNRSYFCKTCCKGYNSEDSAHPVAKQKIAMRVKEKRPNMRRDVLTLHFGLNQIAVAESADGEFYGEQCFRAHLIETVEEDKDMKKIREGLEQLNEPITPILEMKSTCQDFQRCVKCMVTYKVNKDLPHKCLHAQCKHCLEFVPIYEHQCYITSEEEKQFKRTLQKLRKEKKKKEKLLGMVVEGVPDENTQGMINTLIAQRKKKLKDLEYINMGVPMAEIKLRDLQEKVIDELLDEEVPPNEITLEMVNERLPQSTETFTKKIFADDLIFADIECLTDSSKTFIPILICYTRGHGKTIYHHWGTNCVTLFLKTLQGWAEAEKAEKGGGKLPEYTIFFHNLKGFDGVLTTNTLYNQNLKVTDQMGTGTKILHFRHQNLIFKDSLNFLNMPLAAFPKTFGLTELKKEFFPHKFSKLENWNYEGKIPDLCYYEPQHMFEEKKKECETWHAEQVFNGETWNFQKKMLEYCKSDVQLLPEGCLKFAQDTMQEAGFNPLRQCITIASTCHYFWRNFQMQPKTIAVEPVHGWGGLKVNQSKIGLQWLYLEDLKLGGNRIKH